MVGAGSSSFGASAGWVYLFDVTTGKRLAVISPRDGEKGDVYGCAVAVCKNGILVGARGDRVWGNSSGSCYLYDISELVEPREIHLRPAHRFSFLTERGSSYLLQTNNGGVIWENTSKGVAGTGGERFPMCGSPSGGDPLPRGGSRTADQENQVS